MNPVANKILESTGFVKDQSKYVQINPEALSKFASGFDHGNVQHWLAASPLDFASLTDKDKLSFLLVFNSISFCYWGNPKWTIEYKGEKYDGAWGMIVAIKRAIEEGRPILDANYRAKLTKEEFSDILRGNTEIPLFEERYKFITETAKILVEKYDGDFGKVVSAADKDITKLLELIVKEFLSFKDISIYKAKEIYFYKRAQLLISDIHQTFGKKGYGEFKNADQITACADYKLPQALRKFGVLSYTDDLAQKIDTKTQLPHDSEEEIEIRANTIWAIELIRQQVQNRLPGITSMDINDHVWLYTQTKYPDDKPYHLTLTTSY